MSTRFDLARKAFSHTAAYDSAISNYLTAHRRTGQTSRVSRNGSTSTFPSCEDLRYGENPHQHAAFYRDLRPAPGALANYVQLQGKELSYNNIADADAAWECVKTFEQPACVIVKHANPCGVAIAADLSTAYQRAFCDRPHLSLRRHHRFQPRARCSRCASLDPHSSSKW